MSGKRDMYKKHPYSERLEIVSKVLEGHILIGTTARIFDTNHGQLKYRVALYSRYGEEGLRIYSR